MSAIDLLAGTIILSTKWTIPFVAEKRKKNINPSLLINLEDKPFNLWNLDL
jgi:hypothetical protein